MLSTSRRFRGASYVNSGARLRNVAFAATAFATGACVIGFGVSTGAPFALADEMVSISGNHVNFSVRRGDNEVDDVLRVLEILVPGFNPSTATLTCVVGGITNRIYKVTGGVDGSHILVRLYGARTELIIDREEENRSFQFMQCFYNVINSMSMCAHSFTPLICRHISRAWQ